MHENDLEVFDFKAQKEAFDKIMADFEYEDEMDEMGQQEDDNRPNMPDANAEPNAYDIAQE